MPEPKDYSSIKLNQNFPLPKQPPTNQKQLKAQHFKVIKPNKINLKNQLSN
jgi:hypothetical protein